MKCKKQINELKQYKKYIRKNIHLLNKVYKLTLE